MDGRYDLYLHQKRLGLLSDHQTIRPHTFNNYLTPVEKEKRYFNRNFLAVVQN